MTQKQKSLLGGVTILALAGMISKVIGVFFRIPLSNMIGSSGIGLYQAVYPTYTLLLAISSAGIPVAISRMVAERVALGDQWGARRIFQTAFVSLLLIGAFAMVLMLAFSEPLAMRAAGPEAWLGFLAVAPSVLLVSVISAFRGYMQGRSNMVPTAVSQVIEQAAKVVFSFPLARMGLEISVGHAAAGALLGMTIGEVLALGYMVIVHQRARRKETMGDALGHAGQESFRAIAGRLFRIAIPITMAAAIIALVPTIDSYTVIARLEQTGFSRAVAQSLYGLQSGTVFSLINVPNALALAVAMGLVPAISAARAEGNLQSVKRQSVLGLRLAFMIGLPCAVGMSLLATPIVALLYPRYPAEEIVIAGNLLRVGAFTILLFTVVQATAGILQGLGFQKITMYTMLVGAAIKIVLNYWLIGMPGLNVLGAQISSIACYAVPAGINLMFALRKADIRFQWGTMLVRPGLATLGMAAVVLLFEVVLGADSGMKTLLAVAAGMLAYVVLLFATSALTREDLGQMPGGAKLTRLLVKMRIWR